MARNLIGAIERAERELKKLKSQIDGKSTDSKTCGTCNVEKTRADFPKTSNTSDGLSHRCLACRKLQKDAWHTKHKAEQNAYSRKYTKDKAAQILEQHRRYRKADPEEAKQRDKKYKTKGAEAARQKRMTPDGKAQSRAHSQKWRADNPERSRENCRRQQSVRRNAATAEKVSYTVVYERDKGICYLCNEPIDSIKVCHFDHVIPVSKGGSHTYENIRATHPSCNLRKHDSLVEPGAYAK